MQYEALDIETIWDKGIAKPICIAITAGQKILFKKVMVEEVNSNDIINFMFEKCSSKKIYYVHNLSFEMFVFIKYLKEVKINFKMVSANRVVYAAKVWRLNKELNFRCSYRITMLSLRDLASLSGEEAKGIFPYKILDEKMPLKLKIKEEMFNSNKEYKIFKEMYGERICTYSILEEYCKNDAMITKKAMIKYWEIIKEAGLSMNNKILTAARLSIENYFKNNRIIKKKIALKYDRVLRPWYFGGRTEVFGNPEEGEIILHYDWSGMYAQCMSEKILGGEIVESEIVKDLYEPGFYYIRFVQDLEIPILPVRRKKLFFANGEFEGWYWFEEILMAMEYGVKILSVKRVISSQYYDYLIKDFIDKNNLIRKKGGLYKQIGKNNNNTLYGRLGMNPERFDEEILSEITDFSKYEKTVEMNGVFIGYKKSTKSVSNVLVSALITSKARIKLYRGMMGVEKEGGRMMYVDTDSIIAAFPRKNYKEILDKNIGEVIFESKKNDTIIEDGVFAMPKTYALRYNKEQKNNEEYLGKEIVKIKGFNSHPSFEEFKEKFYKKEEITTINKFWSKKDFNISKMEGVKTTSLNGLDKRKWEDGQKRTTPLCLNEL